MYQICIMQKSKCNLQKQKSYICIRFHLYISYCYIYKSRNLIYVLDNNTKQWRDKSTKVEILYMYQIMENIKKLLDLQKQKSYICIRFPDVNAIDGDLQKQKSYICIRFYIFLLVYASSTKVEILYMYQILTLLSISVLSTKVEILYMYQINIDMYI